MICSFVCDVITYLYAKQLDAPAEIAAAEGEKMTIVSARLQILHAARLIARRREGKRVIYSIVDDHVLTPVEDAVVHAGEKH
jgi:DNA-binding transcriptional ArsR family regulator